MALSHGRFSSTCAGSRTSAGTVTEGSPVIGAEVIYGVEEEMALQLSDVVLRRTQLTAAGHPGREALYRCAELMGSRLGWSMERSQAEVDAVDATLRGTTAIPTI